tara:strand:- start:150 stop:710 length:561 start_codon:yes stop_codon:yes gene_type:complete
MKERLEKLGIHPKDIPKALIIFNSMLWLEWLGVLTFCCAVRPIRQVARKTNVLRRIRDKYPKIAQAERYVMDRAVNMAGSRFFRPIPRAFNQSPKDFTAAMAETTVLYNLAFPIWIPLNFKLIKNLCAHHDEANGGASSSSSFSKSSGSSSSDCTPTTTTRAASMVRVMLESLRVDTLQGRSVVAV